LFYFFVSGSESFAALRAHSDRSEKPIGVGATQGAGAVRVGIQG